MHDIFSLPEDGYPEDLLPIRQEIVRRIIAGHIDSAFEMYQYELGQLREIGIRVFELPREHFVLEHRLSKLDYERDREEMTELINKLDELKLAAGFPRERIVDPGGAGKPADLRELEVRMHAAALANNMEESVQLTRQWLERMRFYGYPQPADNIPSSEAQEMDREQPAEHPLHPEYVNTLRSLALALYQGSIDQVMDLHNRQLEQAAELGYPVTRMSREYFELQHRVSQAARRNDQQELAKLQQELAKLQPADKQHLEIFEDPSGVMGLPPAYAEISRACADAFQRGDTAEAVRLSLQMQEMLESSGGIFNLMNSGESGDAGGTEA